MQEQVGCLQIPINKLYARSAVIVPHIAAAAPMAKNSMGADVDMSVSVLSVNPSACQSHGEYCTSEYLAQLCNHHALRVVQY